MEEYKLDLRLVIDPKRVMSHFCWAYTDALLKKLKSLDEENRIFKDGGQRAREKEHKCLGSDLRETAHSVATLIAVQINWSGTIESCSKPGNITNLIEGCQEFLDIFKEKTEDPSCTLISRQSPKEEVQLPLTPQTSSDPLPDYDDDDVPF